MGFHYEYLCTNTGLCEAWWLQCFTPKITEMEPASFCSRQEICLLGHICMSSMIQGNMFPRLIRHYSQWNCYSNLVLEQLIFIVINIPQWDCYSARHSDVLASLSSIYTSVWVINHGLIEYARMGMFPDTAYPGC